MILYSTDFFGLWTLTIWHGSSAFRALLPSLVSTILLVIFERSFPDYHQDLAAGLVQQPYTVTVLIAFYSFLLAFRLNYSYQRYWEATTQVYQMTSSWLDSAVALASFHYQTGIYDNSRPLSFGGNKNLKNVTRERERLRIQTQSGIERLLENSSELKGEDKENSQHNLRPPSRGQGFFSRFALKKKKNYNNQPHQSSQPENYQVNVPKSFQPNRHDVGRAFSAPENRSRVLDRGTPRQNSVAQWRTSFASNKNKGGRRKLCELGGLDSPTPSLFLQEAAHLYSLLSAVAFSALRSDIEGTQSPLAQYVPGRPFPPVNPDKLSRDIKYRYYEASPLWTCLYFFLGMHRGSAQRTMYNAARPFRVLGGASDKECEMLMKAKGPYAQMALCNMWLKEFISREYLNGSTGNIAPPIVGRVYQFISQGVASFNQCRKIAYVPFPFPHSQLVVYFSVSNNVCTYILLHKYGTILLTGYLHGDLILIKIMGSHSSPSPIRFNIYLRYTSLP
jgi:hypothetical protein